MKKIYVKSQLNEILYANLGRWELVEMWWDKPNKAFDNKAPNELYFSGEEGKDKVAKYILRFFNYEV